MNPALVSLTINPKIASTTALSVSSNPTRAGDQVNLQATETFASGNPVPTGPVTFFDGTTPLGPAALNSSGTASLSVALAATGTHSITAQYPGDSNYLGSSSSAVSLVVNPKLTATVKGSAAPNPVPTG